MYQRDVLVRLMDGHVEGGVQDIEWLRVLRFYQEGEVREAVPGALAISRKDAG